MSTPLCMPVATAVSYPSSSNPTTPVIISLSIYCATLLISTCIIQYFHPQANPPPYECHISQPLILMNLPTCPCPTLNQSDSHSFPPLEFTPCSPSLLPPPPSSLPLKDSLVIRLISPVNSLSSSYISSPLPKSNTSEPALMTYLATLASHFALPSPSSLDQFLNYFTPTPSTATWRSSRARSYSQHSNRSISPSPEQNSSTIEDRQDPTPSLPPFPWPFGSPHVLRHLLPPR